MLAQSKGSGAPRRFFDDQKCKGDASISGVPGFADRAGRFQRTINFKQKIDEVLGDEDLGPFLSFEQERRIDRLIESIGDLVNNGRAADAVELVEQSFNYVQSIAESVQEPDDMVTSCFDVKIHKPSEAKAVFNQR